ncbi:MAG: bifunctional aspartate kinase/homoserine dehydrogenase I, partial [Bacteroidales bacterium]|nr:bifunctional aspartate kinase/homoserine dehydrogenase I [Bacteroidales bacterium]
MQVLKFGGTSVADASSINQVMEIIKRSSARDKTIVVASALSGVTDTLIEIGDRAGLGDETYLQAISDLENRHRILVSELIPKDFRNDVLTILSLQFEKLRDVCRGVCLIREISRSTRDLIAGFGELFSTRILEAKCNSTGMSCKWIDSRQIVRTEPVSRQVSVTVNTVLTFKNIREMLQNNPAKILILPGFIASDTEGRSTTLGRGGSDYTASLLAVGGKARMLWIWTDVNGMMTADPGIVPDARTIEHISYKEAL